MRGKKIKIITLLFLVITITEAYAEDNQIIHISQDVRLKPLTENVWMHITDTDMPPWGKVSANGMAVLTDRQLLIIDTPWNDTQTEVLVQWYKTNYEIDEIKIIVTHYHEDNLGGLNWVHRNDIESYSIGRTRRICEEKNLPIPMNILSDTYRFDFSEIPLEIHFIGEGHTVDSICIYLPGEKILFGGCSVKALRNSGLGNIADANLAEWPATLQKMKIAFPDVEIIIPGHGLEGNQSLIDHTLSLF